jgi:putative addiction module component (TIGR02574 family)
VKYCHDSAKRDKVPMCKRRSTRVITATDLFEAAMKLPEAERAELAERLLESLPESESEYDRMTEEEFLLEMRRRADELKADPSKGIPWKRVMEME